RLPPARAPRRSDGAPDLRARHLHPGRAADRHRDPLGAGRQRRAAEDRRKSEARARVDAPDAQFRTRVPFLRYTRTAFMTAPGHRSHTPKVTRARTTILTAAERLLVLRGFHGTSMRDI